MDLSRDMVMMKGGEIILMIDGDMLIMDMDVITSDGIKIMTDGTMIMPDGTTRMMMDDEAVVADLITTKMEEK